jgi:hypothetical protein
MHMTDVTSPQPVTANATWKTWTGRALSAVTVLMTTFSGSIKLTHSPLVMEGWVGKAGYPPGALTPIAIVELACTLLYVIPRTSVLGAVLLTAYLGGAVATHVRVGEPFLVPMVVGIFAWAGLYARDARLHAILPLRALRGPA